MKTKKMRTLWQAAAVVMLVASARAGDYALDPAAGTDTVYFHSTATLEFIDGKTTSISGSFFFDESSPADSASGVIAVDLASLKTGIDLRDRHMRENHLNTEAYPVAFFELTELKGIPGTLQPDSVYSGKAEGYFYIRGIKRRLLPDIEVKRLAGPDDSAALQTRVQFKMNLEDFGIPRPKALFLKLAETVEVEVIFVAHKNLDKPVPVLPDWPERD